MFFEITGAITNVELIARGRGVRSRAMLNKRYGSGSWRKMKGTARVRLATAAKHGRRFTGMKRTASGKRTSKSSVSATSAGTSKIPSLSSARLRFVVCVKNGGYVDLEPLKVYKVLADREARTRGMLRVVDASGEDYLYPAGFFRPIQVTSKLFQLIEAGA
jgi:hypothetical protein